MFDIESLLSDISNCTPQQETEGFRINCCFHEDNTYDLSITLDEDGEDCMYHCFACGAKGHSFTQLIARLYNIPEFATDQECALDVLYGYTDGHRGGVGGRDVHTYTTSYKVSREQLEEQYQQNLQSAQEYYHGNFSCDILANKNYDNITHGYAYLYRRGILSGTLKHFHIIDWQRFSSHPLFIPYAFNGECMGYEQRRISSRERPKTLTMVGTKKSEFVHGWIPETATFLLVTEGALDQAMSWQYGWQEQAQASIMGSHVSAKQAEIMAACNVKYYISAFDHCDLAGQKAHKSFVKQMAPFEKKILKMHTGANGLSFITETCFKRNLDICLREIGLDHTAVLVPQRVFSHP